MMHKSLTKILIIIITLSGLNSLPSFVKANPIPRFEGYLNGDRKIIIHSQDFNYVEYSPGQTEEINTWAHGFEATYKRNETRYPSVTINIPQGEQDWSEYDGFTFQVQNLSNVRAPFCSKVMTRNNQYTHNCTNIEPNQLYKFAFPLRMLEHNILGKPFIELYQNSNGDTTILENHFKTLVPGKRHVDITAIEQISFFLNRPKQDFHIKVTVLKKGIEKIYEAEHPLVDRYGQYQGLFAYPVTNNGDLENRIDQDATYIRELTNPSDRDQYGGLECPSNHICPQLETIGQARNGHFAMARDASGRYWFKTPDGNPFYSLGINGINPDAHNKTPIGRNTASGLGIIPGIFPTSFNDPSKNPDFYLMNVNFYSNYSRSGSNGDLAWWPQRALKRLNGWGFNTVAGFADTHLMTRPSLEGKLPYTINSPKFRTFPKPLFVNGNIQTPDRLAFPGNPNKSVKVFYAGIYPQLSPYPDVFSDDYHNYLNDDDGFFDNMGSTNNDPLCLGIFVDNEIKWAAGGHEDQRRYPRAILKSINNASKADALDYLANKYSNSMSLLNAAWGINLGSGTIRSQNSRGLDILDQNYQLTNTVLLEDLDQILKRYADQYYSTVATALHNRFPNKLYLGSRFNEIATPAVLAAAEHVDVLSFNAYEHPQYLEDLRGMDRLWNVINAAGHPKPMMISEFSYGASDRGNFRGGVVTVSDQSHRAEAYAAYMDYLLERPHFVGAHWYRYTDEVITGRTGDYENYNCGFVNVFDLPYKAFVERVKEYNHNFYRSFIRANPNPPTPVPPTPVLVFITNPVKSDVLVLEEIIEARRAGNELALQANTNQRMIEEIFDLVDGNNNGVLEKTELLSTYIAVMQARRNQDLQYDINQDGIVDRKDSSTMYKLYSNQIPGLRAVFQIVI